MAYEQEHNYSFQFTAPYCFQFTAPSRDFPFYYLRCSPMNVRCRTPLKVILFTKTAPAALASCPNFNSIWHGYCVQNRDWRPFTIDKNNKRKHSGVLNSDSLTSTNILVIKNQPKKLKTPPIIPSPPLLSSTKIYLLCVTSFIQFLTPFSLFPITRSVKASVTFKKED